MAAVSRAVFCVTCDVDMVYPSCPGFAANQFRPHVCMHCSHPSSEHEKSAIDELLRSYVTDVQLQYADDTPAAPPPVVVAAAAALTTPLYGAPEVLEPEPDDEGVVVVHSVDFFGGEPALPAGPAAVAPVSAPPGRPASPPPVRRLDGPPAIPAKPRVVPRRASSRRDVTRVSGSASGTSPRTSGAESPPASLDTAALVSVPAVTGLCPLCGQATDNLSAKGMPLPCARCPRPSTPASPPPATRPGLASSAPSSTGTIRVRPAAPSAPAPSVPVPDKPLVVVPKGFTGDWGHPTPPEAQKIHIVDDDRYSPFYEHYFAGKRKHRIFFGHLPDGGDPVMMVVEAPAPAEGGDADLPVSPVLRGLLFTCKPLSKRDEDRWLFFKSDQSVREQLRDIHPALAGVKWEEVADDGFSAELLTYEQKILSNTDRFKFGLLYIKADQVADENAMFSNTEGSESFYHFMSVLGDRVQLLGWSNYAGGLNTKENSTGTETLATTLRGLQIIFHVSTFLPHREGDEQRLDKKRHLGNDVVVVVFCDSPDVLFDPLQIHSQFNHVFVVVVPEPPAPSGKRRYRVSLVCKPGVRPIEPVFVYPGLYEEGDKFRELFLTKLINAERTSMYAPDFVRKMYRTRKELMSRLLDGVKTRKQDGIFKKGLHSIGKGLERIKTREDLSRSSEERTSSSVDSPSVDRAGSARLPTVTSGGSQRHSGPPKSAHVRSRSIASLVTHIRKGASPKQEDNE